MIWNQPRYFCQRNANAKCRGCARLWQNQLHHITEVIAINAACVLMSDTYLLEAILLTRMNSSTDITSQQKQNSSQHNTVSEISKENVCQQTEIAWLATICQKPCIKMTKNTNVTAVFSPSSLFQITWHGPFVMHHFRKAYVLFHLLLLFTLYIVYSYCEC